MAWGGAGRRLRQRYAAGGAAEEPRRALQVRHKGEGDVLKMPLLTWAQGISPYMLTASWNCGLFTCCLSSCLRVTRATHTCTQASLHRPREPAAAAGAAVCGGAAPAAAAA